jgi:uncharacterized membrane protein
MAGFIGMIVGFFLIIIGIVDIILGIGVSRAGMGLDPWRDLLGLGILTGLINLFSAVSARLSVS